MAETRRQVHHGAAPVSIGRPIMRYHGGKWRLAQWIIRHFPPHHTYVEPFGGSGAVLLQKPRSHSEVYNDRWNEVVNIFRVLRDPDQAARLAEMCRLTPFARAEMAIADQPSDDPVEAARRMIFRSYSGFGSASSNSLHKTGFRSNSRQSGTSPARDWMHWPDHVQKFTERLQGVVIENREALHVIRQHDAPNTLFYLDPPYVHSTRGMRRRNATYRHEMTDDQHRELAETLQACAGVVLVSGYRCPLYEELYGTWARVDRAHYADGAAERVESLWLNPAAASFGQQRFDEVL